MTRGEALTAGLKRYSDGKPCPHGHVCERYTSVGCCVECQRINAESWRDKNRQYTRDYAKAWAQENSEQARISSKIWYQANRMKVREANRRWHKANRDGRRIHEAKRRAQAGKSTKVPSTIVQRLKSMQKSKCAFCFVKLPTQFQVDHIMPLALGGNHEASNLQLLCVLCNQTKHCKHPITFAQQNGRLL